MKNYSDIKSTRRWIIKIGSSLITKNGKGLDVDRLQSWTNQIADMRDKGIEIILVSSGAVAEGMNRIGMKARPTALHELQAAAAIGQMGLIHAWEDSFNIKGMQTAQILLTHEDFSNRQRYLNVKGTLKLLIKQGVIPIVNENDVVANEELRVGDNDSLAALVANLIEADLMILLTDQRGLYKIDPRLDPQAELVEVADLDNPELDKMAGKSKGKIGSGGMFTKLKAARLAERSGAATLIGPGDLDNILNKVANGESVGTLLLPKQEPETARKNWLAGQLQIKGKLQLDYGAVEVLLQSGGSLLAVGIKNVEGSFLRGELVSCVDENNKEVARGLVNYSAKEARLLKGCASSEIELILGYVNEKELIHRDNLVLF
tara:strand:+ start:10398 stop:11522 length:1125 start_codon:yes stop_codon:yes gene_type:complete